MSMAPSSPRLPSPPPPAEDQIGSQSPSAGAQANRQASQMEQTLIDANAKRRVHPGTKAVDMAAGPPLVPLNELDSAFQLQEHLAALHHHHTSGNTQPITRSSAIQLATPPPGIDRTLWLYELCRFLISQCNTLIVGFLFDAPPCSASTCPEMRASEWQFLCAVHEQPKSCCAIDYCCHTLDWAANVVTDPKIFPSRFVVSSDVHNKSVAVKNLVNVFRRLHRIFAHAWFQHRSVFWNIEGQSGLYVFFKTVCDVYDLLPAENYKLPPEAEGLEAGPTAQDTAGSDANANSNAPAVMIAQPPPRAEDNSSGQAPDDPSYPSIGRTNTRRHIRASPSTGSAVTTVMETDEEDHDVTSKLREMHISAPRAVEEEMEIADVPVIVEQEVMADASPDESSTKHNDPLSSTIEETKAAEQGEGDVSSKPEEAAEPATPAADAAPVASSSASTEPDATSQDDAPEPNLEPVPAEDSNKVEETKKAETSPEEGEPAQEQPDTTDPDETIIETTSPDQPHPSSEAPPSQENNAAEANADPPKASEPDSKDQEDKTLPPTSPE